MHHAARRPQNLTLKAVNVDLPAGDRMLPNGPGADVVNDNCLACHSAGMVLNQPVLPKAVWEAEVDEIRNAYEAPIDDKGRRRDSSMRIRTSPAIRSELPRTQGI